jgi:hypothetical protein
MFQNRIYNIFYFQDNTDANIEDNILSDIHEDLNCDNAQCGFYVFLFICLGIGVVAFRSSL